MKCALYAIFLAVWISAGAAVASPLKLAFAFGDSMVLQRDTAVPIWGTAESNAEVSVDFAGQHQSTKADGAGKWSVKLNALPASTEPRDLIVTSGTAIRLHDVLVGEVWIAAGQSNMEFPLSRELHAAEELPAANLPEVRLLNMTFAGQYVFAKRFGPEILERLTPDWFYNGAWERCTTSSARPFSAIAYYFAKDLQKQTGVPIGIINLAVGGSPTEAWIRRDAMAADPQLQSLVSGGWLTTPPLDDWCKQRGRENLGPSPVSDNHAFKPGFLWEAGIARLIPFSIRGVIWYQGESNSLDEPRMLQHEFLFRTLVADWRKSWGIENFPFLYCQLSGIGTANYKSEYWPDFRDQQRRLLAELPNTAMAVTSDYGNKSDVHPREKREIGHRLSAAAMALAYGSAEEWQGPLVDSVTRKGGELIVTFKHATGGLSTADQAPMRGFEIAGDDRHFVRATAVADGTLVHLSSTQVPAPVSARYDWQPCPDGNVINGSHFPCSTFKISLSEGSNAH